MVTTKLSDGSESADAMDLLTALVDYCSPWLKAYVDLSVVRSIVIDAQRSLVPRWGIQEREMLLDEMKHRIMGDVYKRMEQRIQATDEAHKASFPIEVLALSSFCVLLAFARTARLVPTRIVLSAWMTSVILVFASMYAHFRVIITDAPPYVHYLVTMTTCAMVAVYVICICSSSSSTVAAEVPKLLQQQQQQHDKEDLTDLRREVREMKELVLTTQTAVSGMLQIIDATATRTRSRSHKGCNANVELARVDDDDDS